MEKNCTLRCFKKCNKHEWDKVQEAEMVWHVAYVGKIRMSKIGF